MRASKNNSVQGDSHAGDNEPVLNLVHRLLQTLSKEIETKRIVLRVSEGCCDLH